MKNVRRCVPLVVLSILVIVACETPPEVVDEVPPEVIPVTEQERARNLRNIIIEYELDQYAVSEFLEAEEYFEEAEALMEEDVEAAAESYMAAIGLYEHVLSVGFAELIGALRGEIADARARAEGIRADVAARVEFDRGVEAYEQAQELELEGSWEPAYQTYGRSLANFESSYEIALEKRTRAEEAITRAGEKEAETERQVRAMEDELAEELDE